VASYLQHKIILLQTFMTLMEIVLIVVNIDCPRNWSKKCRDYNNFIIILLCMKCIVRGTKVKQWHTITGQGTRRMHF
jgi:hypothetical protein